MALEARLLHVSDTHLGYRQYNVPERERDIYEAFHEVVEIAVKERVDYVVHTGDFFDTARPPPQALREAVKALKRLREHGIPVVAILGDHDLPRRKMHSGLLFLEDIRELTGVTVIGRRERLAARIRGRSGVEAYFAGFSSVTGPAARQQLLERLRLLPPPPGGAVSVLMLHQALREASPMEYDLELGELPRGYSYYALGHIHVTRIFSLGDSAAAYPGSIEALRRDEARQQDKRYVLLVDAAPGRSSVQRVELRSVRPQPVYTLRYSPGLRGEVARLVAELARLKSLTGKEPLVHVIVEDVPKEKKAEIRGFIEKALEGRVLRHRVEVRTREEAEVLRGAATGGRVSPEQVLREMLREEWKAELAYRLVEILGSGSSSDVEEAVKLIKEKLGIGEEP